MEHSIPHDEDDDEDGHDEYECQRCIEDAHTVSASCRCGECCRLLVQATLKDADREPKIREVGLPVMTSPDPDTGQRELYAFLLPQRDGACVFQDPATKLCSIYATRPTECRIFNCDGEGREQLIELGILPPEEARNPS